MAIHFFRRLQDRRSLLAGFALITLGAAGVQAETAAPAPFFTPYNVVLSRSVYDNNAANIQVGIVLPPNCASTQGACSASTGTTDNGKFPYVFNNNQYDGSFGITSRIFLDELDPYGNLIQSLQVPNSMQSKITPSSDQLVTSFSSKSELSLHQSLSGKYITFMGYVSPVDAIDVSNANTPGDVDPTNPVGENVYRAIATVDANGKFTFTETNAYSGNNGRSAILNDLNPNDPFFYTAGNAGNGANPQPNGVILGAGAQLVPASTQPESLQSVGQPTPVGSFNITELGQKADKIGKDDNFRGLAVYNNVVYFTKGSGSNGVNTVYFIDTTGTACPNGVGLPVPGAALPTTAINPGNLATLQTTGLPSNMCILAGFNTTLAKTTTNIFPFGLYFANPTTLYVADEGDGTDSPTLYAHAAASTTAGLQKWIFNSTTKQWQLAYVMQNGLNLGVPYTVAKYPTGNNPITGLPWDPATDGLRNITGYVLGDQVVIYGITSTVSGAGDQGADPNELVAIEDTVANTNPAVGAAEQFRVLKTAGFAEVLRGVAITPGTPIYGSN